MLLIEEQNNFLESLQLNDNFVDLRAMEIFLSSIFLI